MVPSLNSLLNGVRQQKFTALIHPRHNLRLRANGPPLVWQRLTGATRWHFRSRRKEFDAAIMALVIFFVPDPGKGVAEMVRVVRPGGIVAAYAWDILGGGFTLEPLRIELRSMGLTPVDPPSVEASRMKVMQDLWTKAGLAAIETRQITVQRTFVHFEEFWSTTLSGAPSLRPTLASMSAADIELFKTRVRARLPADTAGQITYESRANAVKGDVSA
jgi:SAM-dependent methyltransferase